MKLNIALTACLGLLAAASLQAMDEGVVNLLPKTMVADNKTGGNGLSSLRNFPEAIKNLQDKGSRNNGKNFLNFITILLDASKATNESAVRNITVKPNASESKDPQYKAFKEVKLDTLIQKCLTSYNLELAKIGDTWFIQPAGTKSGGGGETPGTTGDAIRLALDAATKVVNAAKGKATDQDVIGIKQIGAKLNTVTK